MLSRHRRRSTCAVAGFAVVLLVSGAFAAKPSPTLPAQMPAGERARLQEVAEAASVSARAAGEPFIARPDVFEFLLDHPEFATHVTRALKLARYRIWRGPEGGLWLDDGWGVVGQFSVVYATSGTRVAYAHGQYQSGLLPSIKGQAVIDVLEYRKRNVFIVRVRRHAKHIHADIRIDAKEHDAPRFVLRVQLFQPRQILSGDRTFRPQEDKDQPSRGGRDKMVQWLDRGINRLQPGPLGSVAGS